MRFSKKHLVYGLLVLSAVVHLAWLGTPSAVVFDEVHFGKFVTAYCCSGERVFDIHPPHGKLLIAAVSSMSGYGGGFTFDHIGQEYHDVPVFALRLMAALAGILIPWLGFVLLRQVGVSFAGSLLGGLVLLFDNALVLQSRLISLDSMLVAATLAALAVFWAADSRKGKTRVWLYVLTGALAGLAVGIKFTGLAAPAVVGFIVIYRLVRSRTGAAAISWVRAGVVILLAALAVYGAGWWLHYALLTQPGPGDAWQAPTGNVVRDTIDMHRIMFDANYNLTATHPNSSYWWSWPYMGRSVFYWQGSDGGQQYFLGNPVVWWGGGVLFLLAVLSLMRSWLSRHGEHVFTSNRAWVFLLAYVVAYAPFVRIPRALFLYHYLAPLIFSLLFGLWWLDTWLVRRNHNVRIATYKVIAGVVLVGFVLFSPLTYGFDVSAWQDSLFWLPGWR